jgi:hypothetical protein
MKSVTTASGSRRRRPNLSAKRRNRRGACGLEDHRARLDERGIALRERDVPGQPLHQLFLADPDGVTIEINFRDEA